MGTQQRTIFVVDDDEELNEVVVEVLAASGYCTRGFCDGLSAIDAISAGERPDLLLLDWRLPGATADDVLAHLEERGVRLRVLVYSAFARQIPVATRQRVSGVLAKPCTLLELHGAVERALSPSGVVRAGRREGARPQSGTRIRTRARARRVG
jgi:DNA-binding NtrC family response regulator